MENSFIRIKKIRIHTRLTTFLFSILLIASITFSIILKENKQKIINLNTEISTLQNIVWLNDDIKDSLMSSLESTGYLKYYIETESNIKIPKNINSEHIKIMFSKSLENNIPISIMFRLVYYESSYDSTALSNKGAFGYMQLMPATYNSYCSILGIEPIPHTVYKNITIGTYMLRDLYEYWNQHHQDDKEVWNYVLASYNMGLPKVLLYGYKNIVSVNNYVSVVNI